MRPLGIILLGCTPLAVLTISAFVELGSPQGSLLEAQAAGTDAANSPLASRALELEAHAKAVRPVAAELVEVELLADAAAPSLEAADAAGPCGALARAWDNWGAARGLIAELGAELSTLQAQPTTGALERLEQSAAKLRDLKTRCEASAIADRGELVALVDQQLAALDREITRRRRVAEADLLLAQARAAFAPQRYGQSAAHCRDLLSRYADVLEPDVAEKVRLLQQRAEFWDDAERLRAELETDGVDLPQAARIAAFLGKYRDRAYRTSSELEILGQYQTRLGQLQAKLDAAEKDRAAAKLLQALSDDPPARLEDRLQAASRLAREYPTPSVKGALRAGVGRWLAEFLPEKQVSEHPMLQETETTGGQIVRGFFKSVTVPGSAAAVGYKRYLTYEEFLNPVAEVGTYREQDLKKGPGPSVPQACAARYNEARARLIEHPEDHNAWADLAGLCDALEKELEDYAQKPGSELRGQLSFAAEARFAGQVLAGKELELIGQLTRP